MAFLTTPTFMEELTLGDLSNEQFLVIAAETAKKLGWRIDYISQTGLVAFTDGVFSWNAKVTVRIQNRIASIQSESTENESVDFGENRSLVEKFTDTFMDVKHGFTTEELSQKYTDLAPDLVSSAEDMLNQPLSAKKENAASFFSFFIPRSGYFITPILLDLNILIFILMVISGVNAFLPDTISLINWGANFRPMTLQGEWWRLITNCFLHIGIIHLAMNMYALLYIGLLLEPYLGKKRFLAAYLLTGVAASLASLCWHDMTVSAGASGAIFGMYGVFLALLTTNLIDKSTKSALLSSIVVFVGYNLLNGLRGGIDNAAHIGGLISGLVIGYTFYISLRKPDSENLQNRIIAIWTFLVISACFVVYEKMPNDIGVYDKQIRLFAPMENTALSIYRMPKNASRDQLLSAVRDSGIHYWHENIKLINEMEKLNIPQDFRERDKLLLHYCNLRINSYNFLYKAIDENTKIYKDSIAFYDGQIEDTLNELNKK